MNKKLITKIPFAINNPGNDFWGKVKRWGRKMVNRRFRRNSKISLRKEINEK